MHCDIICHYKLFSQLNSEFIFNVTRRKRRLYIESDTLLMRDLTETSIYL